MKTSKNLKPTRVAFQDYIRSIQFDYDAIEVVKAYADCLPENLDIKGLTRNLKHTSFHLFSLDRAKQVMSLAVPDGYNGFSVDSAFAAIVDVFGPSCRVMISRENSVCIYVKPDGPVWLSRDSRLAHIADEVSFEAAIGMFRLWWD